MFDPYKLIFTDDEDVEERNEQLCDIDEGEEDEFDPNECPECGNEIVEGFCVECGYADYEYEELYDETR